MRFPLVVSGSNTLMIAPPDFFEQIGKLDLEEMTLEINVDSQGRGNLSWLLDADAVFYELSSLGPVPAGLLQKIRLRRRREKFRIIPGRSISVCELAGRIHGLVDQFQEAPNVTNLKEQLSSLPPNELMGPDEMSNYLVVQR